ncbi:MAG: hypothetical protein HWD59_05470 [Coxiellaceae bacterium]|nr:MAG: hypothetical protein HWD59_05470 [Coxiellaceae bacterium]
MYFYGKGVTKDLMMAQHWMRLSAQQGYPDAARALSVIDHMLAAQNPVFSLPAPSLKMVPDY